MPILRRLQAQIPEKEFNAWILDLDPEIRGDGLCLRAPFRLFRDRVEQRYAGLIREAAGYDVRIVVGEGFIGKSCEDGWRREFASPSTKLAAHLPRVTEEDLKEEPVAIERVAVDLGTIIRVVAINRGFTVDQVLARDRTRKVANARREIAYFCRTLTSHSLPAIGEVLGGRNHTSILRAVRHVAESVESDPAYGKELMGVFQVLKEQVKKQAIQ